MSEESRDSVWVGNVTPDMTEQDLKDVFSKFGEVRLVEIPNGRNSRRLYAFIHFVKEESVNKAIAEGDNINLKNVKLVVNSASKPRNNEPNDKGYPPMPAPRGDPYEGRFHNRRYPPVDDGYYYRRPPPEYYNDIEYRRGVGIRQRYEEDYYPPPPPPPPNMRGGQDPRRSQMVPMYPGYSRGHQYEEDYYPVNGRGGYYPPPPPPPMNYQRGGMK